MAIVKFDHLAAQWLQLQLALYMTNADELFPTGAVVIQDKTTGDPLLVSDGNGMNAKAMSDAELSTLINAGKPSGYNGVTQTLPTGAPILVYTNRKWNGIIRAAKEDRDRVQSVSGNPMEGTF